MSNDTLQNHLTGEEEANKAMKDANARKEKAQCIVIKNDSDAQLAGVELKETKSRIRTLDEERKKITKPLDDAKKAAMELFKKPTDILLKAEQILKQSILTYNKKQEDKRREEEAKLQREADKRQRELEAQAKKHEEKGNFEKAEARRALADEVVPAIAPTSAPKIAGIQKRTIWGYKVVDLSLVPREYMIVNETMLGQTAKSSKGTLKIPGVEFFSKEIIAA